MGIRLTIDDVSDETRALAANGVLDGDQVWYVYLTQNDGHVRPSHQALHGTVWQTGDPNAPVPPIDWGCRCFMSFRAKPGTMAARVLPEAEAGLSTRGAAFSTYLDDHADGWRDAVAVAAKADPGDRLSVLVDEIQKAVPDTNLTLAREYAMMATEATKGAEPAAGAGAAVPPVPPPPPVPPAPPNPGPTPSLPPPKQAAQAALEGQPLRVPTAPPTFPLNPLPDAAPAVIAAERQIARRTTERIAVFDGQGNFISDREGKAREVFIPAEAFAGQFRNATLTHNHPSAQTKPLTSAHAWGTSLSGDDIAVAIAHDAKAIRAVSPAGMVFEAERGTGGWPDLGSFSKALADEDLAVRRRFWQALNAGTMTGDEAEATHSHEVWKALAPRLGFVYRWGHMR